MKVDKPYFGGPSGLDCHECPLHGIPNSCEEWHNGDGDTNKCPTRDTYSEACALADTATKRAVKEYGR